MTVLSQESDLSLHLADLILTGLDLVSNLLVCTSSQRGRRILQEIDTLVQLAVVFNERGRVLQG